MVGDNRLSLAVPRGVWQHWQTLGPFHGGMHLMKGMHLLRKSALANTLQGLLMLADHRPNVHGGMVGVGQPKAAALGGTHPEILLMRNLSNRWGTTHGSHVVPPFPSTSY